MNASIRNAAGVLSVVSIAIGVTLSGVSDGWAQSAGASAKSLVGTWTLVSQTTTTPDGKKIEAFGSNPQGVLIFDTPGRYSLQICRTGRAKFASGSRDKGTAEENQATVQGCNPHWGTYSVDEKAGAILFNVQHAMYPNWEGIQQKRTFTITGDQLKYVVPAASTGGTSDLVWKRLK
jgi:hypothetical protein